MRGRQRIERRVMYLKHYYPSQRKDSSDKYISDSRVTVREGCLASWRVSKLLFMFPHRRLTKWRRAKFKIWALLDPDTFICIYRSCCRLVSSFMSNITRRRSHRPHHSQIAPVKWNSGYVFESISTIVSQLAEESAKKQNHWCVSTPGLALLWCRGRDRILCGPD